MEPIYRERKEREKWNLFVFLTLGFVFGRGEGKGFVSYDLRYRPSHSYKVDTASRAGRLGSFSYVSI